MDETLMEVDYFQYCPQCKDYKTDSTKDPCNECLGQGYNYNSSKPINFKEKEE